MRLLALLTVGSLVSTSCAGGGDEVVIGVVGPAKGPYADTGRQMREGAIIAAEQMNRRGGVDGRTVRVEFRDDSNRSLLGGILRELVGRDVAAIIGPEDVGPVASSSSIPARSGTAVIALGSAGRISSNRSLFRLTPSNEVMAQQIADWLVKTRGLTKVAIAGASDQWGRDGMRSMTAALRALGVSPVASQEVGPGSVDLAPQAQALRSAGADAVVGWLPPADAARLLLSMQQIGFRPQFAGPDVLLSASFRSIAGTASDNTALVIPKVAEEVWFGQGLRDWFIDHHRRFTIAPIADQRTLVADLPWLAISAYDAVNLVLDAVQRADSSEPREVARLLRRSGFDGVLGPVGFHASGEAFTGEDVQMARFFNLAFLYDVTPGADLERQAAFYKVQVSSFYVPESYQDTKEGRAVYDRILEDVLTDPEKVEFFRDYSPPRQPPGPL